MSPQLVEYLLREVWSEPESKGTLVDAGAFGAKFVADVYRQRRHLNCTIFVDAFDDGLHDILVAAGVVDGPGRVRVVTDTDWANLDLESALLDEDRYRKGAPYRTTLGGVDEGPPPVVAPVVICLRVGQDGTKWERLANVFVLNRGNQGFTVYRKVT